MNRFTYAVRIEGQAFKVDFARHTERPSTSAIRMTLISLLHPGLLSTLILRAQLALHGAGLQLGAKLMRQANLVLTGADFALGCTVGPGFVMRHPNGVVVGIHARIGANCTILQQVTLGDAIGTVDGRSAYPNLEDGVTVGAGAKVLGGVTLGAGSRVGANAVVLMDVPPDALAVGVPARLA